jgi:Uncharacterized conserved small protein
MNIKKAFAGWTTYRNTVRELSRLDNRTLDDLGITRGDIDRLAREHARSV